MLSHRRTIPGPLLCSLLCVAWTFTSGCLRQYPLKPYTAYVVNHHSATLAAVDLAEFRITAMLPVTPEPEHVLARPPPPQLYVLSGQGKISVTAFPHLRLVTTLDIGRSARSLSFSSAGTTAFV